MKRLYLLRHAEAASSFGSSDMERTLTTKGQEDAKMLGLKMKDKSYTPDLTLCSPATRTRQTLTGLTEALEGLKTDIQDGLYGAAPSDMLSLVQSVDDRYSSLLIVAHNPTIHHVAAMLCEDSSPHYNSISMQYAPCTLSVIDCDLEQWADIQPAENQLIDLLTAQ